MDYSVYNKVLNVINSCLTMEQLIVAEKYITLYRKKYGGSEFLCEIDRNILSKKMSFKNGWSN